MTTVIIQSDSEKKTHLLMQLAEELGLSVKAQEFVELDAKAMAFGMGRPATDEELEAYLKQGNEDEPVDLDVAVNEYLNRKQRK